MLARDQWGRAQFREKLAWLEEEGITDRLARRTFQELLRVDENTMRAIVDKRVKAEKAARGS